MKPLFPFPFPDDPHVGDQFYRVDLETWSQWDGSVWISLPPDQRDIAGTRPQRWWCRLRGHRMATWVDGVGRRPCTRCWKRVQE